MKMSIPIPGVVATEVPHGPDTHIDCQVEYDKEMRRRGYYLSLYAVRHTATATCFSLGGSVRASIFLEGTKRLNPKRLAELDALLTPHFARYAALLLAGEKLTIKTEVEALVADKVSIRPPTVLSAVLLLALAVPATSQAGPLRVHGVALGAFVASSTADLVTTERALARPGTREVNPVLAGPPAQRVATKLALTSAVTWLVWRLGQTHPRAAAIVGLAGAGAFSAAAVHNAHVR